MYTLFPTYLGDAMHYTLHDYKGTVPNCHVLIHDGPGDQVRDCKRLVDSGDDITFRHSILRSSDWTGRSFGGWDELVRGVDQPWTEGIAIVEEMVEKLRRVELPEPMTIRRKQKWTPDDGDFDLDRAMIGHDSWKNTTRGQAGGPQTVTMLVQINASARVSWQSMMWRGAVCVAMATILEEAGYATEIQAFAYGTRVTDSGESVLQSTHVKRAGDPLDISALVNATSAWYRRTVGFVGNNLLCGLVPGLRINSGHGFQCPPGEALLPHLVADTRTAWQIIEVWNEQAAVSLAKAKLATLSKKEVER